MAEEQEQEKKASGKKTILVVEDDQFLRELIVQKLESEGYEIVHATDGEKGVAQLKKEKPDIVLLDLILPGIDGFEVLKQAKEDKETASIPIIILSNLGQQDDVERGLKLGASDYLIKAHFTPKEIAAKVQAVLQ